MPLSLFVGDRDLTNVAEGLSWSTVDPGGCEALSFQVPTLDHLPTIGDRCRLYEGLEPVWDGRVEEAGQDYRAGRGTGRVSCVGAGAALRDREYSMVYVDRDLSRWMTAPSTQRRTNIATSGYHLDRGSASVRPGESGDPAVEMVFSDMRTGGIPQNYLETWYDAGPGNRIAAIYADVATKDHNNNALSAAAWTVRLVLSEDDVGTGDQVGTNWAAGGSGYLNATGSPRWARIQHMWSGTTAQNGNWAAWWRKLAVFGDHGLTRRGTVPDQGFYTSDIVRHALNQATGIDPGVIEDDTGLIITQAAYYDPVTPERVIDDMARRSGFHWGVWPAPDGHDTPRLHFTAPPESATAIITRADVEDFQPSQRLSDLYDTVHVRYRDAANGPGVVTVTRPNPFLPAALAGRERTVDFGIGSQAAAEVYGETLLALWEQQARAAGPLTLPGTVQLPGGGTKPAHLLRAGVDRLQVTDLPNAGPWTETDTRRFDTFRIRRTESRVERGGRVVTSVELDAGADLVEVLNARLQDAVGIVD